MYSLRLWLWKRKMRQLRYRHDELLAKINARVEQVKMLGEFPSNYLDDICSMKGKLAVVIGKMKDTELDMRRSGYECTDDDTFG